MIADHHFLSALSRIASGRTATALAIAVFGLVFPAAASADSGVISDIRLTGSAYGAPLQATFSATHDTCSGYCGWFAEARQTTADRACTETDSLIWVGPNETTTGSVTETDSFYPAQVGVLRFCLLMYYNGALHQVADVVYDYEPAPAPVPTAPPGGHTDLIPSWIGRQAAGRDYYANETVGPSYIYADRFVALVKRSASRWGAVSYGATENAPCGAAPDGENVVGFSYALPSGVLGLSCVAAKRKYRRGRLRCRTVHRNGRKHRVCHRGKRRGAGWRIIDDDVAINALFSWQEGPYYPNASQYDLETTLLHELGHFSGNPRHVYGCEDSPLRDTLDTGEWWRAPNDWARWGCASTARAHGGGSSNTRRGTFGSRFIPLPASWEPPAKSRARVPRGLVGRMR
jgi:hypothetical protein